MTSTNPSAVQMTPERFLQVWQMPDILLVGRFGILNGLEVGNVLVQTWNHEVTQEGLEAFAEFLIGLTQASPRTDLNAKAWKVLLRALSVPKPWYIHRQGVYLRVYRALSQDQQFLDEDAGKQPFARLIDGALQALIGWPPERSLAVLDGWRKAVVATGRMDLVKRVAEQSEQRHAFQLLLVDRLVAYVQQLRLRFPAGSFGFSSAVKQDPDSLVWSREWERRRRWAETLLMLLAEGGEFDELIKL